MITSKIFIIKINKGRVWEKKDYAYRYLRDAQLDVGEFYECAYEEDAMLMTFDEANRLAAWLNKININYFEIDVRGEYDKSKTRQSKMNFIEDFEE